MKGLSVLLALMLLAGAQLLATKLKRSGLSPAQHQGSELPAEGGVNAPAQHSWRVLHT